MDWTYSDEAKNTWLPTFLSNSTELMTWTLTGEA